MDLELENDHVMNFLNGFESIVKQAKYRGIAEIGGCETYTVGVMRAEGIGWSGISGQENFISESVKKLWEMVNNFFKGVWNFFFSAEKVADKAEEKAKETVKIADKVESAVSKISDTPPKETSATKHYSNIEAINKKSAEISKHLLEIVRYVGDSDGKYLADCATNLKGASNELDISDKIKGLVNSAITRVAAVSDAELKMITELKKVKEYKVPTGNRVDKSAVKTMISLVGIFNGKYIVYSGVCRAFFRDVEKLLEALKEEGEEIGKLLRQVQIGQAVIARKMKFLIARVKKTNDDLHKLDELVESK